MFSVLILLFLLGDTLFCMSWDNNPRNKTLISRTKRCSEQWWLTLEEKVLQKIAPRKIKHSIHLS